MTYNFFAFPNRYWPKTYMPVHYWPGSDIVSVTPVLQPGGVKIVWIVPKKREEEEILLLLLAAARSRY